VGILTACIKRRNVIGLKTQTLTNFILKLNSKLNGINFDVKTLLDDYLKEPTMILGADVTHPSPNSTVSFIF
jgi:eukaryotic translation initiation factor 2C